MATHHEPEYPVCLIAIKGNVPTDENGNSPKPILRSPNNLPTSTTGSLDEFSSDIGCSGVVIDHQRGLVLTTALPFTEVLNEQISQENGYQSDIDKLECMKYYAGEELKKLQISVIIPPPINDKSNIHGQQNRFKIKPNSSNFSSEIIQRDRPLGKNSPRVKADLWIKTKQNKNHFNEIGGGSNVPLVFDANVVLLWQCQALEDELKKLLPKEDGWELDYADKNEDTGDGTRHKGSRNSRMAEGGKENDSRSGNSQGNFVSWFALLQVDGVLPPVQNTRIKSANELIIGQPVVACGTPFATLSPSTFLNSLSSGIVTNLGRPGSLKSALLMTDARCMPGMEGGGIFVTDGAKRSLAGIIVSPLCWKSNEWIGLSLACSLEAVLDSLHQLDLNDLIKERLLTFRGKVIGRDWQTSMKIGALESHLSRSFNSIVLIKVGNIWGSGVIVDGEEGLILTCRHVVKSARLKIVSIKTQSHPWMKARVVYMTSDLSPFDLAILRIDNLPVNASLVAAKLSHDCLEGSRVYAAGYPLFDPSKSTSLSVTSGIVSKVIKLNNEPVMIQSSCAVHSGASGGALLSAETGRLLGLIASNSRDIESKASFPHVNFSIPVEAFRLPLAQYLDDKDLSGFHQLERPDERITQIWDLKENGTYRRMPKSKL